MKQYSNKRPLRQWVWIDEAMFRVNCLRFLVLIGVWNVVVASNLTIIDELTGDYLKANEELWKVVKDRETNALDQIYNVHDHFLHRNFGETNVLLSRTYAKKYPESVIDKIIEINRTSQAILDALSRQDVSSELARQGSQLGAALELILQSTEKSFDFRTEVLERTFEPLCQYELRNVLPLHQVEFDYYKDIRALLLRTHIAQQMSFMILHLNEGGKNVERAQYNLLNWNLRNKELCEVYSRKLDANRDVWACDPTNYTEPGANLEISNFLRSHFDNEVNLNSGGSFASTCADYQSTTQHNCRPDTLCAFDGERKKFTCNGRIVGCSRIDDKLTICPTEKDGDHYKFVKAENGELLFGNDTSCPHQIKLETWRRWFYKCSNCYCWCESDLKVSERYFGLNEVVSDTANNKIITGIQLVKYDSAIQFIIAERELQANGVVETYLPENETWTGPANRYDIPYHTLSYELRSLNMDTVTAPNGHVATGVRLRLNERRHLQLEVRFTEFDFSAGQLGNVANSQWLSNPNGGQTLIDVSKADVSTKTVWLSQRNTTANAFIRFGPANDRLDLAQHTIPFLDTQKVQPHVPTSLAGIGLHYKGQPGYGGFVAPFVVVYDFTPYIPQD